MPARTATSAAAAPLQRREDGIAFGRVSVRSVTRAGGRHEFAREYVGVIVPLDPDLLVGEAQIGLGKLEQQIARPPSSSRIISGRKYHLARTELCHEVEPE